MKIVKNGNLDVNLIIRGSSDGPCQSLGIQICNVVTMPSFHMHTHSTHPPSHAVYLDNYLPQVQVHSDTIGTCCHWRHCIRESRRQPFRGQWGAKRGGGVMMTTPVCVCVLCRKISRGNWASMRQASRQAYVLLITQGLPQPLGAVSNMRERNQPVKNRSPPQSSTDCVCVSCVSLCMWLRLQLKPFLFAFLFV